jgi:hypothetical protein
MAVIWKGTSLAGNGTEPYPNIDITATALRGGDGAYIATDYSIRVTGQMVATGSLVVAGERQNSLFGKINAMAAAVDGEDVGKLDIQPYGGGASNMTFPDAKLTSVNFSEAPENSAQVQFQDYSLEFTARKWNEGGTTPTYKISEGSVSWSYSVSGDVTTPTLVISPVLNKGTTVTITAQATGYATATSGGVIDQEAARNAQLWCKHMMDNLQSTSNGKSAVGALALANLAQGKSGAAATFDSTTYTGVNKAFSENMDIPNGTYSLEQTITLVKDTFNLDYSVEGSISDQNEQNTITVQGTCTPYDTSNPNTNTKTIENKLDDYDTWSIAAASLASHIYSKLGGEGTLKSDPTNSSLGYSPKTGEITFNFTFDDGEVLVADSISSSVQINDVNKDQSAMIVAVIPVIARPDGPILQDIGTPIQRTRSLTITATMKKANRTSAPDVSNLITTYTPPGTALITGKSEQWNPTSGSFTLDVEWTY